MDKSMPRFSSVRSRCVRALFSCLACLCATSLTPAYADEPASARGQGGKPVPHTRPWGVNRFGGEMRPAQAPGAQPPGPPPAAPGRPGAAPGNPPAWHGRPPNDWHGRGWQGTDWQRPGTDWQHPGTNWQPHGGGRGPHGHPPPPAYHPRPHPHYPRVGLTVSVLPPSPYYVRYGAGGYYYAGGAWYRPWGASFVVVAPPIGVYVPTLPGYYVMRHYGGVDYYYANDVYYTSTGNGYRVVSPPVAEEAEADEPVFAYPRENQSEEQQARDKWECHSWAQQQSGFDPTRLQGGGSDGDSAQRRDDYRRANEACMDARGYSMR